MKFDFPSNLFQNPAFNDYRTKDVEEKFMKSGGKILGRGKYATVYYYPKWNYVLKTFVNDPHYLQFVRFVIKNPRQSYPKFFDKPRKILPNVKRTKESEFLYIVRTELLFPITKEEFNVVDFYSSRGGMTKEQSKISYSWEKMYRYKLEIEKKYPHILPFHDDYQFLNENVGINDWTISNVMKRKRGEFVIVDPLWEGETPYQTYDRLMKSEMGFGDDDYAPTPEYIRGGKKYKKPNPVKPKYSPDEEVKPKYSPDEEEIPF
jgi:hypothetical protein